MKQFFFVPCVAILLTLISSQLSAQHGDFPAELQQLLIDQIPVGSTALGSSVPGFSDDIGTAFSFLDTGNGAQINYVLCYPLADSSITGELESGAETPMSGTVFIYCPGVIDLAISSQFLLFFQQVTPAINSVFTIESQTIDLQFTTSQAVTDNFADYCFFDSRGFDCLAPACVDANNNLDSMTQPLICLAGCCGNGADFRLPGIQYQVSANDTATFEFATDFDFGNSDFRQFFQHYSFFVGLADEPKIEPFFNFQTFEIPLYQPGDANRDGNVDLLDVAGFVDCLTGGSFVFQCDTNRDLTISLLDIEPFVDLLTN